MSLLFIILFSLFHSAGGIVSTSHAFVCKNSSPAEDSIPHWVKLLYEKNDGEFLNGAIPEVTFFKKLSDSSSYCLYEVNDGVCGKTFLAIQKQRDKYKLLQLSNECDADFSIPEYSVTTYRFDTTKNTFHLTTDTEKPRQKYLTKDEYGNVDFKEGYNMENAETITITTKQTITIPASGRIIIKN